MSSPSNGASSSAVKEQEFRVRIPTRNSRKSFHIMKFNASLKMDPAKWPQVRMVREPNKKADKTAVDDEENPKFGAGSEFGREQREEARRRRFGGRRKQYNPDNQPWLMRVGSKKEGKQYRGTREGGVAENTSYYVFTHAADGSFEAHPVKDWYNFAPRVTHKTFDAEEAEEKFAERGKILNHWAMMVNKKLKPGKEDDDDDDLDEDGKKKKKGKGQKGKGDLKVSDMDDWVDDDDGLDSDTDDEKKGSEDEGDSGKKGKKKASNRSKDSKKKNKKKEEADLEGLEDSDDGDDEGREVDYMSDESSDSEDELIAKADIKGVEADEGLSKMLDSDESDEEDNEKKDDEDEEDETKPKKEDDDDDGEDGEKGKKGKKKGKGSKNSSRAATPTPDEGDEKASRAEKRKNMVDNLLDPNAAPEPSSKKSRMMDPFGSQSSSGSSSAAGGGSGPSNPAPAPGSAEAQFEEEVRKYLARKPMTAKEILKKVTIKKSGMAKEEIMPMLVNALKRINPHKHKVKGIMYLSLKT